MPDPAIAIPNLLYRYADLFDAGRFEEAARLFDHGCVVVGGREIRGADAIQAMWDGHVRLHADGTPRTRHLVTNPRIDLDDDGASARCRSQWTVLQPVASGAIVVVGTGRYDDRFAVIDGAWCFTRRDYAGVDFWGDTSAHLKTTASMGTG